MSDQYLHLSVNFAEIDNSDQIEKALDRASDWLRYMPYCWLIYTAQPPRIWYDRLRPMLGNRDHLLIVTVELDERAGWLPKSVWEWINSERLVERAS